MLLSEETINILRNLGSIHSYLHVMPGNEIRTASDKTDLVVIAKIEETFERQFVIGNLNMFLSLLAVGSKEDTHIDFEENEVVITKLGGRKQEPHALLRPVCAAGESAPYL